MSGRASTTGRKRLLIAAVATGLGLGAMGLGAMGLGAMGLTAATAQAVEPKLEVHPASKDPQRGAARMIQDLGQQTANVLGSEPAQEPARRRSLLRSLVRQGFDLELTSQFVLGKYWNRASSDQQAEFVRLFTEYLLNSYARHLASFRADTLSVVASNTVGEQDILVETNVSGTDGPVAPVWRVRAVKGLYKIIDVTVDGVSLALTQRREFASVVNRVGLEGLLQMLRDKLDAQAETTGLQNNRPSLASFLGGILASPNASRIDLFVAGK